MGLGTLILGLGIWGDELQPRGHDRICTSCPSFASCRDITPIGPHAPALWVPCRSRHLTPQPCGYRAGHGTSCPSSVDTVQVMAPHAPAPWIPQVTAPLTLAPYMPHQSQHRTSQWYYAGPGTPRPNPTDSTQGTLITHLRSMNTNGTTSMPEPHRHYAGWCPRVPGVGRARGE